MSDFVCLFVCGKIEYILPRIYAFLSLNIQWYFEVFFNKYCFNIHEVFVTVIFN